MHFQRGVMAAIQAVPELRSLLELFGGFNLTVHIANCTVLPNYKAEIHDRVDGNDPNK